MIFRKLRRYFALAIVSGMLFSINACALASSQESSTNNSAVPSQPVNQDTGILSNMEDSGLTIDPVTMRYYVGTKISAPECKDNERSEVAGVVPSADSIAVLYRFSGTTSDYMPIYRSILALYGSDGTVLSSQEVLDGNGESVGRGISLTQDPEGGYVGLFENGTGNASFVYFNIDGKQKGTSVDLNSVGAEDRVTSLYVSSEDRILVIGQGSFIDGGSGFYKEFSREGKILLTKTGIDIEGTFLSIGGTLYVSGYVWDELGSGTECLYKVESTVGIADQATDLGFENFTDFAMEDCFYGSNSDCFYRIPIETGIPEPVFFWNRTDLLTANSWKQVYPFGDGSFFCIQSAYNTNILTLTILVRQPEDYLANKTILTLASIGWSEDRGIQEAITSFNRGSENYRIEYIDYYARYCELTQTEDDFDAYQHDYEKMQRLIKTEIMAGGGPDMLIARDRDELADYENSGLLMDLVPVMEADSDFDQSLFVESVWNAAKTDGSMYSMPLGFCLRGMIGGTDFIGERTGWTFDEFDQVIGTIPPDDIMMVLLQSPEDLLSSALPYSLDTFVDSANGTVNFDQDEFGQLLDFAKKYGAGDLTSLFESGAFPEDLFRDNATVFYSGYGFGEPWSYSSFENNVGESGITFCGFPSVESEPVMADATMSVAIVDHEEVSWTCWEFLQTLLSEPVQRSLTLDFEGDPFTSMPLLSSLLDEYILFAQENADESKVSFMDEVAKPVDEATIEEFLALVDGVRKFYHTDKEIEAIILEEAAAYFSDQKSREEVMAIIQDRMQTYVSEST